MDESVLRHLVREVVARHLADAASSSGPQAPPWKAHASHLRLELVPSPDGTCIVEPAVRCTHCGYCQSMGH